MKCCNILLALILTVLAGCTQDSHRLTILVTAERPAEDMAKAMKPLLQQRGLSVHIEEIATPESIMEMVANDSHYLAIVEEPDVWDGGVLTILPLYPTVLHVVHRADVKPESFPELVRGKNIYAGPPGGAARKLLLELSGDFGMSAEEYSLRDDPWTVDPDVFFIFGGLFDDDAVNRLTDYRLFSFGAAADLGTGTVAEGVALNHPNIRAFVLPRSTYPLLTDKPILTLSIRSVLIGSAELDSQVGYDVVRQLVEHAPRLSAIHPLVSRELHLDFDPVTLILPLHPGTRRFIDRDKPTFIERYVEVIALVITMIAALGSGILAVYRYGKQRKKDRVDVYYRKILDLRQRIRTDMAQEDLQSISAEVRDVQEEVFALLIDERVNADETLTIFLDLSNQVLKELEPRLVT